MSENKRQADHVLVHIDRVVRPLALWIGGAILIALMMLTVFQVFFRYVLNSPILGADDVAQVLLISMVTFCIAQSGRTGGQVAVELLGQVGGEKITRWTDIVVKIFGVVMMVILALQLFKNGLSAADFGEASVTIYIPFGPFFHLLGVGMLLYGAVLVFEIYVHVMGGKVVHDVGGVREEKDKAEAWASE